MNDTLRKLVNICKKEKINRLALADPDEGVIMGGPACSVHALYGSGKKRWHVIVHEHGRYVISDAWFDTVNEMCLYILNLFDLSYGTNKYVNEFQ